MRKTTYAGNVIKKFRKMSILHDTITKNRIKPCREAQIPKQNKTTTTKLNQTHNYTGRKPSRIKIIEEMSYFSD